MRIALCTTTINVPHVLKLYRACDPAVKFFVAGDYKTPRLFSEEANTVVLGISAQNDWKCSEPISWNTLARRNIAFLEAVKWGADIIVSIDDDNLPVSLDYFTQFHKHLALHSGLLASSDTGWFDPGQMLFPWTKHRGVPHGHRAHHYDIATNVKVGVAAGLVLGDPDIDATTRMELRPDIHQVSELARSGVVVSPCTHTVFNSQNSAILREFVPAWFMMPGVGRMDDIYASLIVQRVMRERDYHVFFGQPFVWQQRNKHDLIKDLRAEIDGYENVPRLADLLDHTPLKGKSVIDDVRTIYGVLAHTDYIPKQAIMAANAWLDDCEEVL